MSWSTYNAEAEAPRIGRGHQGMAAVSEGHHRDGSADGDASLQDEADAAPAAPLLLPNGMTVADVEAMLVELRTVAALEVGAINSIAEMASSSVTLPQPQYSLSCTHHFPCNVQATFGCGCGCCDCCDWCIVRQ